MEWTREEKGEPKYDRLSDLNDDLIRKIYSSMSYIESARFRLISKRLSSVCFSWLWDFRGRRNNRVVTSSLKGDVVHPEQRYILEIWHNSRKFTPGQTVFVDCPHLRELTLIRCNYASVLILNSVHLHTVSLVNCHGLKTLRLDHTSHLQSLSYISSIEDQADPLRLEFNSNSPKVLQIVTLCRANKVLPYSQRTRFCFDKTHKHVWINSFTDLTSFYFIPGIKSFSFRGYAKDKIYPTVDLVYGFTTLTSLNLYSAVTTSRMINGNMSSNRFLKYVRLIDCQVRLSSELVSLTPRCYLKKAKLGSVKFFNEDGIEYGGYSKLQIKLRDFLYSFCHCTSLKLSLEKERMYIYPKKLRKILKPPLCEVKNLKLQKGSILNTSIVNLVDNFLWLAPRLNTLSLHILHFKIFTIKFHYATQLECVSDQTVCHSNAPQQVIGARHEVTEIVIELPKDFKFKEKLRNYFLKKVKAKITIVVSSKKKKKSQ